MTKIKWRAPVNSSSEPIYLYEQPDQHEINLWGMFIDQHGRKIRCISLTVQELDRISRTPEIGNRNNKEMADLFLQQDIPWQRKLNIDRVPEINSWWKGSGRPISPNNSVLFFKDLNVTDSERADTFEGSLNPADWCFQNCPNCNWSVEQTYGSDKLGWYADCCPNCNYCDRPAVIVDGQHRIRGMSYSPDQNNNHKEKVFSTWLCKNDGFTMTEVAKIFTEITSAAVQLSKLHKEFLLAKFRLKPTYNQNTRKGRIRLKSYEIASGLNLGSSPWANVQPEGRVTMIERDITIRMDIVDVFRLTNDFLCKWFENGTLDYNYNNQDVIDTLENYINALISVYPAHYWDQARQRLGALQQKGVFRLMLDVFECATKRLMNHGYTFPISSSLYEQEIGYVDPIKWDGQFGAFHNDSSLSLIRKVLVQLFLIAPCPVNNTKCKNSINNWLMMKPDNIVCLTKSATVINKGNPTKKYLKIELEFCANFNEGHRVTQVAWPLNAKSSGDITIEKTGFPNRTSQQPIWTEENWKHKDSSSSTTTYSKEIEMSQLATLVNVGDSIEVKPVFRSLSNTINSSLIKIRVR